MQVRYLVRKYARERDIQWRYVKRHLFYPHGFRRCWNHQLRMDRLKLDLIEYMRGHVLPYRGRMIDGLWRISRGSTGKLRTVCLRPVVAVTKEEVRAEVLNVLLVKISLEDI